jgi:hypothetical protein
MQPDRRVMEMQTKCSCQFEKPFCMPLLAVQDDKIRHCYVPLNSSYHIDALCPQMHRVWPITAFRLLMILTKCWINTLVVLASTIYIILYISSHWRHVFPRNSSTLWVFIIFHSVSVSAWPPRFRWPRSEAGRLWLCASVARAGHGEDLGWQQARD